MNGLLAAKLLMCVDVLKKEVVSSHSVSAVWHEKARGWVGEWGQRDEQQGKPELSAESLARKPRTKSRQGLQCLRCW